MSNHLAIATVTATLQRMLQNSIQGDVSGARVTTLRPDSIGIATPSSGVNLFLYHVPMNYMWGNSAEIQRRNRRGDGAIRSRTALDMHYMISCYGNEAELEPQRLLGSVIRTLTDFQQISRDTIRDTLEDAHLEYLNRSTLTDQFSEVSFMPINLTIDELSKIWSVFFQTPYCLSMAYKATVVMIEGEQAGEKALPVRDRPPVGPSPLSGRPQIIEVTNAGDRALPIEAHSTIVIRGTSLQGSETQIRIGAARIHPTRLSEAEIFLDLSSLPPETLHAGIQSLKITYNPTATHSGRATTIESNLAPFVLRPTILDVTVVDGNPNGRGKRNGGIEVTTHLPIQPQQRVVLSLNEWSVERPANYLFEVPARSAVTHRITIPFKGVKAGDYLVRLHVDGAESCLQTDSEPESETYGWYIGPRLLIG